jgi:hypothetical protein
MTQAQPVTCPMTCCRGAWVFVLFCLFLKLGTKLVIISHCRFVRMKYVDLPPHPGNGLGLL